MSFNKYYQSELIALRKLGAEFSERNPALAPFLANKGRDPDVERLLEGFAFLTGRLRQKLDDELPELIHTMFQMLWPSYLRPIPSFSMLAFEPKSNLTSRQTINRGCAIDSVEKQGINCRFETCYDTDIYPLKLQDVNHRRTEDGDFITLKLKLINNAILHSIDLNTIRLHLTGERSIAMGLYLTLIENLESVNLELLDDNGSSLYSTDINKLFITPGGVTENEGLVDEPLNTFIGYRYLQEYYCFPEKFLFIDVNGLDFLNSNTTITTEAKEILIHFKVSKVPPDPFSPTTENIRLHCTPIVNLFKMDSMPLQVNDKQTAYRVIPGCPDPKFFSIYSVDKVQGWQPGGQGQQVYHQFESFNHDNDAEPEPYYSIKQTPAITGNKTNTFISFNNRKASSSRAAESVSLELSCCNHDLPQTLNIGDINLPTTSTPDFVTFTNISLATATLPPNIGSEALWQLLSNMSLNYQSLSNLPALRSVLRTYDFPAAFDNESARRTRLILSGLKSIQNTRMNRFWEGLPIRGIHTRMEIDAEHFICEGDMYLFASILNEFFALYSSINSFHELEVHSTSGTTYRWQPRMGSQTII